MNAIRVLLEFCCFLAGFAAAAEDSAEHQAADQHSQWPERDHKTGAPHTAAGAAVFWEDHPPESYIWQAQRGRPQGGYSSVHGIVAGLLPAVYRDS